MACKTVNFTTECDLYDTHWQILAKWLSCNGEVWGIGPTAVFASAAALFLYSELQATIFVPGDQAHITTLEKGLISTMVVGMLALMIHLWVCSMRFFQYYLDTLIRDSPNMLLEMTTAGILGSQTDMMPIGPLTKFLKQQQPQIHITICWFLSLCYADYVRKKYSTRFNMPYLETWQAELQERANRGVHATITRFNNFIGVVHQRLRGLAPEEQIIPDMATQTEGVSRRGLSSSCVSFGRQPSGRASCGNVPRSGSTPAMATPSNIDRRTENHSREVFVKLVGQSSETTADVLDKLRMFVRETQISCAAFDEFLLNKQNTTSSSCFRHVADLPSKPINKNPSATDTATSCNKPNNNYN